MSETTKAGKSSQSILAVREPMLTPLVAEEPRMNPVAYCRFRDVMTALAPELVVRAVRR